MKYLFYIVLGFIFHTSTLFPYSKGIDFQDKNWADILKTAQSEGKYIFIDAYADYCLPCKAMEKEIFSQTPIADFYNQHFVNYKMDIEADKNDYLVQIYQIKELPALLFLSPEGVLLQKVIGKQRAEPLLNLGNQTIQNKWTIEENESLISLSKLIADADYYKMHYGGRMINWMVKKQVYVNVLQAGIKRDIHLFQFSISAAAKANLPDSDRFHFSMQTLFYQITNDWQSYYNVTNEYLSIKKNTNPRELNEIAWTYYLYISDSKQLQKAIKWIEKSIQIESEDYNNYTYAALLYKIGASKKAYKVAKRAMYIAERRGMNTSHVLDLVKKNTK
ncbi:MAG: thioredoxin family protein [Chitinophagales bacterium]